MRTSSTRRGGFSLIELLTVIAIMAVLAAISGAVYFRMRASAMRDASNATVSKLASLMDVRWKAEVDAAKNPPAEVVKGCLGDRDRALALWTMAKLRSEFPQSFAEATSVVNIYGAILPKKQVFESVATKTYTPAPTAEEQAAALLYVALTQAGRGGQTQEGLGQQVGTTAGGLTVFVDSYGQPITFVRFGMGNELNEQSYSRPNSVPWSAARKAAANNPNGVDAIRNMLDPTGKLLNRGVDNPWGVPAQNPALPSLLAQLFPGQNFTEFPNMNIMPVIISAGENKQFGQYFGGNDAGDDNILSFRLRREGDTGN